MTDYTTINTTNPAPLYPPSDYNTPNNQIPFSSNNANQNQSSIQLNQQQPYDDNGNIFTYTTPFGCSACLTLFLSISTLTGGTLLFFNMYFQDTDKLKWIIPFFINLIGFFLGITTLKTSIKIDLHSGIIEITDTKFFCCFNGHRKVQINDIKQIILKNYLKSVENGNNYNSKLIFKLVNGKEVKGFDISDDHEKEGRNAFEILRNVLPKNIPFEGNLT